MAAIKPKPKFLFYQALYEINQAFEAITHQIEVLRQSQAVAPDLLNLHQSMAEELRAGLNHMVVDKLNIREIEDWGTYANQRLVQETALRQK